MTKDVQELARRLAELGRITDEPGRLTRTFLSPAMARSNRRVARWMRAAGLAVRFDPVGNVIGTTARRGTRAGRRTLLLGSHLDTVRDAGIFDGALGVLLPLTALEVLRRRCVRLPFDVEVIGFSEEEGVRFSSAYLGSEGYAGRLTPRRLCVTDANGITAGEALRRFNGGRFFPPRAAHRAADLLGYVEVHLEQGPVLESKGMPVGVVSAIAGQSRFQLTWSGRAGHAGTTPMALRRDALAGAAEFILAAERLARATRGLVATVGVCGAGPGAANVIAGRAVHTLDVRHERDAARLSAVRRLRATAAGIARRRGLRVKIAAVQDNPAVPCDPALSGALARGVAAVQGSDVRLVSGAGHDAVVLSALTPVAMLFVRCREGLSHHPREHVSTADLAVALRVLVRFLGEFHG
ncbi:MAG: allantoate amidohydrolase [Opitutaceae bacterium]